MEERRKKVVTTDNLTEAVQQAVAKTVNGSISSLHSEMITSFRTVNSRMDKFENQLDELKPVREGVRTFKFLRGSILYVAAPIGTIFGLYEFIRSFIK